MAKSLYSYPVTIYATAYIVAESEKEADRLAKALIDSTLELPSTRTQYGDLIVSGEKYSARMPQVSLSPSMDVAPVNTEAGEFVEELTD